MTKANWEPLKTSTRHGSGMKEKGRVLELTEIARQKKKSKRRINGSGESWTDVRVTTNREPARKCRSQIAHRFQRKSTRGKSGVRIGASLLPKPNNFMGNYCRPGAPGALIHETVRVQGSGEKIRPARSSRDPAPSRHRRDGRQEDRKRRDITMDSETWPVEVRGSLAKGRRSITEPGGKFAGGTRSLQGRSRGQPNTKFTIGGTISTCKKEKKKKRRKRLSAAKK